MLPGSPEGTPQIFSMKISSSALQQARRKLWTKLFALVLSLSWTSHVPMMLPMTTKWTTLPDNLQFSVLFGSSGMDSTVLFDGVVHMDDDSS